MKRRKFIGESSLVSLGFIGLKSYANSLEHVSSGAKADSALFAKGYGPLKKDPKGVLELPRGFSYNIISQRGDQMADGLTVPGLADGMGTFAGATKDQTIIIRNHEVSPRDAKNGAFGVDMSLLPKIAKDKFYDYGYGKNQCLGGTSTMIYNHSTQMVEKQWMSLAGTVRNCAGGITPWGSWITCEESTVMANNVVEQNHGYNFEVPATNDVKIHDPIPLKEMGRFNHEAVCVDPRTGIVYQTEDRPDGMIYRYVPNVKGELSAGGKLQILSILEREPFDTRNWTTTGEKRMKKGKKYQVKWLDIDNVEAPLDDLRARGKAMGGAVFARGEGIWFGKDEIYFACTNGGKEAQGQIFRYTPSLHEAQGAEEQDPGTIELFLEPNNSYILESCDNLTIAANGDLVICEDLKTPRILGVTPQGKTFVIAKNVGYQSEFAGAVFSPDGSTLFVNIQKPGLTIAITGPWAKAES